MTEQQQQFSTRLMGEQGDLLIVWSKEQDEATLEVIKKKMAQGFQFFLIEPRMAGFLPPTKTPITDFAKQKAKIIKHRTVEIKDVDFDSLQQTGKIEAKLEPLTSPVKTKGRAKTPEEVVKADTVAVRPRQGG